jgi:hypothetical protein
VDVLGCQSWEGAKQFVDAVTFREAGQHGSKGDTRALHNGLAADNVIGLR